MTFINDKRKVNAFLFILFLFVPFMSLPVNLAINSGIIVWILTIIIILLNSITNKVFRSLKYYLILGTIVILLLTNLLISPYKQDALVQIIEFGKFSLVPIFLGFAPMNYKAIKRSWYRLSLLTIFIFTILILNGTNINYMNLGTSLVISSAGIVCSLVNRIKWYDILLLMYSLLLVVLFGNRGALLALLMLYIFVVIFKTGKKGALGCLYIGVFVYLIYCTGILYTALIKIDKLLKGYGVFSYSVSKIIMQLDYGVLKASSGRNRLFLEAWGLIQNAKFLPMGLGYYQSKVSSPYPHNFLLDLLLIFGFFSIPILTWLIWSLVSFFKSETNMEKKIVVILLLIISITRLMLSGTFISCTPFWMWVILVYKNDLNNLSDKIVCFIRTKL